MFNDGEFSDAVIATARVAAVVLAKELDDQQALEIAIENKADSAEKVPDDSLWHSYKRAGSELPLGDR